MGEADGQDVAEVAESDKDGQHASSSAVAKDVAEEEAGHDDVGSGKVVGGDGGKIGDGGEDVEHGAEADGERAGHHEGAARIADLGQHVVGVFPALEAVDDAEQGRRVGIGATAAVAAEIAQVEEPVKVVGVGHATVAGEGGEAGDDDEGQHADLEDAEHVEQPDAPLRRHRVQGDDGDDQHDADGAGQPAVGGPHGAAVAGGIQNVAAKGERVAGREAQQDHLRCQHAGGQQRRPAVDALEIVLLAARARDGQAELEVRAEAGHDDDASHEPEEDR